MASELEGQKGWEDMASGSCHEACVHRGTYMLGGPQTVWCTEEGWLLCTGHSMARAPMLPGYVGAAHMHVHDLRGDGSGPLVICKGMRHKGMQVIEAMKENSQK